MNHVLSRRIGRLLVAVPACVLLAGNFVRAADVAAEVPRYALKVGQELRFESSDVSTLDDGGRYVNDATFTAWVVRTNADGSWHVMATQQYRSATIDAAGKRDESPAREELDAFALFPDGRIVGPPTMMLRVNPGPFFPRLPESAEQLAAGWASDDPGSGGRTTFRPRPDESRDGRVVFDAVGEGGWNEIYLMSSRTTYRFDPARGVVADAATRSSQGWGIKSTGEGRIELKAVEHKDGAWLERFAADADAYLRARDRYDQLTRDSSRDGGDPKARVAEGEAVLKAARDAVQTPAIRVHLDTKLAEHGRLRDYLTEQATARAERIGQPSPKWAAVDLDGQMHALKRYKGKVLVLDFWYRGCGWCIRAMPQVNEVAQATRDKPVVVFGMNTDEDVNDARFVVEKMGLTYVTLKAKDIVGPYRVRAFPTLVILDQQGVVRDIHVGYTPTLKDEVMATIGKLLAEGEKTAAQ